MKSKFGPRCGDELPEKNERSWREIIEVDSDTLFCIIAAVLIAAVFIVLAVTDNP